MGRWESALGIRDGERGLVFRLLAVFALTQSTHALGSNSADALFFLRFGVERLPLMILVSGFAVMIALLLHVALLGRSGPRSWLPVATGFCGTWALALSAISYLDTPAVYPVIWVSTQVVVMVTFTIMWNSAAASVNTRQAKRLYPLFAAAGVAGGIVGNLLTGPLAAVLGTQNLLAAQGLILGVSTVLLVRLSPLFVDVGPETKLPLISGFSAGVRTTTSSRHLRLVAGVVFALSSLFYLVVFPFNETVAASFLSEESVAGFLGVFASISTGLTFLVSLFVTNRIFSRVGIVAALGIVPVMYALGFGTWFISLNLLTASLVRASQWITTNAIGGTATTALYNVVTGPRRNQVMILMTAIPAQLGIATGGGLLVATSGVDDRIVFGIGLVISIVSVGVIVVMRAAYLEAIINAVKKGLVGVFTVPHEGLVTALDKESIRVLIDHLSSDKKEERLIAVAALKRLRAPGDVGPLTPLLNDHEPTVRAAALDWLCTVAPERVGDHIDAGIFDPSPIVRLRALELGAQGGFTSRRAVQSLLDDPDPHVRAAAAMISDDTKGKSVLDELLATEHPDLLTAVLNQAARHAYGRIRVEPYLRHSDPTVRTAATRAARHTNIDPEELAGGLEDESMLVRETTAQVLSETDVGRSVLISSLESGTVSATQVALDALTPISRFTADFITWAQNEARRARMLTDTRAAIEDSADSPTTHLLVKALSQRAERLTGWVLQAMTTPDTEDQMGVVRKGISSAEPETRAQAVEAVDVIGDHSVTRVLMGLLEADSPHSDMSPAEGLEVLAEDFDPWLRTLSRRSLAENGTHPAYEDPGMAGWNLMPADSHDSLGLVDRVIALQKVRMFSDLDLEDLELIADAAKESHYGPGELIYRQGDEGTEMLVIIEGEVVITASHDSAVKELARYGAGQFVGELALLREAKRSADVTAGHSGVHGLIIDRTDLISILHERPDVSMAMLGTLAARLADQV